MDVESKRSDFDAVEVSKDKQQHVEDVPLDFIDPHRAALEMNPEHSEKLSWSTILAVIVCVDPPRVRTSCWNVGIRTR